VAGLGTARAYHAVGVGFRVPASFGCGVRTAAGAARSTTPTAATEVGVGKRGGADPPITARCDRNERKRRAQPARNSENDDEQTLRPPAHRPFTARALDFVARLAASLGRNRRSMSRSAAAVR